MYILVPTESDSLCTLTSKVHHDPSSSDPLHTNTPLIIKVYFITNAFSSTYLLARLTTNVGYLKISILVAPIHRYQVL